MKIESDLLKLLMAAGFMASNSGRLNEAGVIFDGVAKARPDSAYPQIGLGCVAMERGDFAKASEIFRDAPARDRNESDLSQAFLGMALKVQGFHDECRTVLTQLQEEGENPVAVRMADDLLEGL